MSKRVEAKAAARMVREEIAREKRRKRLVWMTVSIVGAVAILGMITWGVIASRKTTEFNTPANASADGSGIVSGTGAVTIDAYSDFLCPYCKKFHDEAGPTVQKLVDEGKVKMVYHPVAYLDQASTNKYPTRASAASGCAADAGKYTLFADVLFANQPPENGPGPTDDELIAFGSEAGLPDSFAVCVKEGKYVTWVSEKVNESAGKAGVTGTPTVFVNGEKVNWDSASIMAAVTKAS